MLKKLCNKAGCHNFRVGETRYCEKHQDLAAIDEEKKSNRFAFYKPSQHTEFYTSKRWRDLSQRVLKENGYCCQRCGRSDIKLDVHHNYPKGYNYWNDNDFYNKDALVVLCPTCHRIMENK